MVPVKPELQTHVVIRRAESDIGGGPAISPKPALLLALPTQAHLMLHMPHVGGAESPDPVSAPRRRRGRARAAGAHLGRPKAWLRSSFNWLKKLIAARRLRRRCVRSCPDPHRGESTYCAG